MHENATFPVELDIGASSSNYNPHTENSVRTDISRPTDNNFTNDTDSYDSCGRYSVSDIEQVTANDFCQKFDSGDEVVFVVKV